MGVIMEIINMTSEDIGNLKKLSLDFFNAKGDLLLFRYNNVLRLLKTLDDFTEDDFQKHFNAVSLLNKYRDYLPSDFVIPDFLVKVDDIIKFFAINYVYGNNLSVVLKDDNVSLERKKNYLNKRWQTFWILVGFLMVIKKETNCHSIKMRCSILRIFSKNLFLIFFYQGVTEMVITME